MFNWWKKKPKGYRAVPIDGTVNIAPAIIAARGMDLTRRDDRDDILGIMLSSDPSSQDNSVRMVFGLDLSQVKRLVHDLSDHLKLHGVK